MYGFAKWAFTVLAVFALIRIFLVAFEPLENPWMKYAQDLLSAMIAFSVIGGIALAMWLVQ